MNWLQIGKGVYQGCILLPCLFNLYAEYIMQNAGLSETQTGIKIARRNRSLQGLLRVPWTARRSNQSILKETNPEYSLEGLMLKLKLQYFGHLMRRADSLEKTLILGKIEGRRRRGWQKWDGWMSSPTQWTWVWTSLGRRWRIGKPDVLQSKGSQKVRHNWETERQQQMDIHLLLFQRFIRCSRVAIDRGRQRT